MELNNKLNQILDTLHEGISIIEICKNKNDMAISEVFDFSEKIDDINNIISELIDYIKSNNKSINTESIKKQFIENHKK